MPLFSYEQNRKMKVFSKLYVGLKKQGDDRPLLGFATPYEDNAAFEKRKSTIRNWCGTTAYETNEDGSYKRNERGGVIMKRVEPETRIIDNEPAEGFMITDDVKRIYWGGGNVVWRVLDPRGFELEIQSSNLMALIQVSGINSGGLIPGKCVWGRDGASNILLHESSEEYKNAITAAETMKKDALVPMKDRVIGAEYILQSGDVCTYVGKLRIFTLEERDYPGLAGRRPYVPVKLPSGNVISTQLITQGIKDSGTYEGIILDGAEQIMLYKKAPLHKRTENSTITNVEVLLDKTGFYFAGAGNYSKVVYAAREVTGKVAFQIQDVSDARFNKIIDSVKRASDRHYHTNVFDDYGFPLPAGFIDEDGDISQLWGCFDTYQRMPSDKELFFSPVQWDEDEIKLMNVSRYFYYSSTGYDRRYTDDPPTATFLTRKFEGYDGFAERLQKLRDEGRFFEITVTEVEDEDGQ